MSINVDQFRQWALAPAMATAARFGPPVTDVASALLIGIFSQETHLGEYLHQLDGPGLGIGSMQPLTLMNVLRTMPSLLVEAIRQPETAPTDQIVADLRFACVTARWYLWIQPQQLPPDTSPASLWVAYRDMWCRGCRATEDQFIANCRTYGNL